jgi:hypothetical protein
MKNQLQQKFFYLQSGEIACCFRGVFLFALIRVYQRQNNCSTGRDSRNLVFTAFFSRLGDRKERFAEN